MRTERCQPLHEGVDLFGAIRGVGGRGGEIEVNPVLDRLRLRNPLEEHPGPHPGRIFDGEGGVEILLGPATHFRQLMCDRSRNLPIT